MRQNKKSSKQEMCLSKPSKLTTQRSFPSADNGSVVTHVATGKHASRKVATQPKSKSSGQLESAFLAELYLEHERNNNSGKLPAISDINRYIEFTKALNISYRRKANLTRKLQKLGLLFY